MNRIIVIIVLAIALGNIAVLDYLLLTRGFSETTTKEIVKIVESIRTTPPPSDNKCPGSCLDAIKDATSAATAAPRVATAGAMQPSASRTAAVARESFITVGTGSYSSEYDWGDVPGAQVTIDGLAYGPIRSAVFEATVTTPNGAEDVQLRLYNVTDSRPVWNSDLFFPSGSQTRFLVSPSLTLEPGAKLYKVQMKTQFKTNANLDVARIHVTTQ